MITPAKWQAKGGQKNEDFRKDIVPHMEKVVYYPETTEIFNIREVSGISYFLIDKNINNNKQVKINCVRNNSINSNFECHDEIGLSLQNRNILKIIGKVGQLGEGFKQSLYVKNTDFGEKSIMGQLGFKRQVFVGEQDRGNSQIPSNYVEVMQGNKCVGYKKKSELFTTLKLDKYKVTTSVMAGNIYLDDQGKTLGIVPCNIIGPNQVPKGSYPVLMYFDSKEECKSFKSYYESKLVSFLFYFGACGSTLTKEFYRFIPDPGIFDKIYEDQPLSGYVPDKNGIYIDDKGNKHCALYIKYKLTQDEINIIESIIKERT